MFEMDKNREVQIVKLHYARDVGLISWALNDYKSSGILNFFDSVDFEQTWSYEDQIINKNQDKFRINITAMDYSETNGLLALGGTEGNIIIIDWAALKVINNVNNHSLEIIQIFFYDDQHQLISIGKNGTILIWDVHKMEVLQTFKDENGIRYAMFDYHSKGVLFTISQYVKQYLSKIDPEIELKVLQVNSLAKDFEHETHNEALFSGPSSKASNNNKDHIKEIKNCNVLITPNSNLVFADFLESHNMVITVSSKNLVRLWDLEEGESHSSYNIEMNGRITAASIDKSNGMIVVGNDHGQVKIWNIFSGGLLYDLPEATSQITELKFVKAITDISLVGTCWNGKVMMWTQPNEERNYQIDGICSIGHRDDILWIDSDEKYIATGGADGLVSVWSILSGMLIHSFPVPVGEGKKPPTVSNNVVALKLVKKQSNLLYVCHETGDIHWVDASNGNGNKYFAAKAPINSNWDLDRHKEKMLVVGDTGKALLFKINNKTDNWTIIKKFETHSIMIYDNIYVWSVKASTESDIFMTATINGNVKLWTNDGDYISDINQPEWPKDMFLHISK